MGTVECGVTLANEIFTDFLIAYQNFWQAYRRLVAVLFR